MSEMRKLMESLELFSEEEIEEGRDVREVTNKIIEAMDVGIMDPRFVAETALAYMSEAEVAVMARDNDWVTDDYEEYMDYDDDEEEVIDRWNTFNSRDEE